jgi:proline iminopeptidase
MGSAFDDPHAEGMLGVGDGQRLYWTTVGNPRGRPAVALHGGPGSGTSPLYASLFDLSRYRVVLFDQRGCGRSTPHAGDPRTPLTANTTGHLVADIERLRVHLGVSRWVVLGLSWGSTLGLAYAERYPEHVTALVLGMVVTGTRREVQWITRDMGRFVPEAWDRFRAGVPEPDRDGDLADAYARLLESSDPQVRERAAIDWCAWEDTHIAVLEDAPSARPYEEAGERLAFARLVTHYWRHACFLEDGQLLRDASRLAGIPGTLVHGRLDLSSPVDVPWHLHRHWPDSELVIVDEGRHSGGHGMREALRVATDRYVADPAGSPPRAGGRFPLSGDADTDHRDQPTRPGHGGPERSDEDERS